MVTARRGPSCSGHRAPTTRDHERHQGVHREQPARLGQADVTGVLGDERAEGGEPGDAAGEHEPGQQRDRVDQWALPAGRLEIVNDMPFASSSASGDTTLDGAKRATMAPPTANSEA